MPTNLGTFLKSVKTEVELEGFRQFKLFKSNVTKEALRRIVSRTPVDTGRLKGNWEVGVNSIPSFVDENRFDKGGEATIARGESAINSSSGIFDDLFIANNIRYLQFVHDGTPKMAARPFVEAVATEMGLEFIRF